MARGSSNVILTKVKPILEVKKVVMLIARVEYCSFDKNINSFLKACRGMC